VLAFQEATGNRGVGGMTAAMENFGYTIDAVLIKLGQVASLNFFDALGLGFVKNILSESAKGYSYLLGVDQARLAIQNEIWKANTKTYELAAKNAADQAAKNKEYLAFLAKQKKLSEASAKLAALQAKLNKAKGIVDIDQVQIIAALQGKISDEERTRLELLLAIQQENGSEAERLAAKLAESQLRTTGLASVIANLPPALNPLKDYPTYVDSALSEIWKIQDALNKLKAPVLSVQVNSQYNGNPLTNASSSAQMPSTSSLPSGMSAADQSKYLQGLQEYRVGERASTPSGRSAGDASKSLLDGSLASLVNTQLQALQDFRAGERASSPTVNVTVQGNVISNKDLADTIRMQLLDSSASGSFTMSNRATRGD
jgi:hypothetical protein